jgi:hypothetical protein
MTLEWVRSVKLNLAVFQRYTQAVYAEVDDFLSPLTDADLDRAGDLSTLGFEDKSVGRALTAPLVSHTNSLIRELSCLKGLQGSKRYPF